jgi:hypothetical protein
MSTLTSLARAIAVERQTAQPICIVRHVHISEHPLVFIPLALAGEANAPLAVMIGDNRTTPELLTVAEPRDRDQRFAFAADPAAIVLEYITSYTGSQETIHGKDTRIRFTDAPQLLVPNQAGVAFTRLLGRSTRFRKAEGQYAVAETVPVLGRWLTFYTERTEVPPSSLTLAMTEVLALHWATGQSPVEDLNLGALLGWIDPPRGLTGAQAAAQAEDPVRCPPAGPATDPTFDNELLEPRFLAVRTAKMTGGGPAMQRAKTALSDALATQLEPTWSLMWRAVDLLRGLSPGGHVSTRWDRDRDAFTWHANHLRDGGPPQPRRDSAVSAARRLADLEKVQAEYAAQRTFDDPLVMAESRMTGEAFAGTVVAAEPDRIDATGRRRVLRPRITVETDDVAVPEPGAVLTSPARPAQETRVVSATLVGESTRIVLDLKGGMGRALTPEPGSVPAVGESVCYATFTDGFQRVPEFPAPEDTPWTHGGPPPAYVPSNDDAREV